MADEHDPPTAGFVRRHRRAVAIAGSAALVVVLFGAVTAFTGLSAPGALQRYRYGDLRHLATEINATAGDLRTPDDCWRALTDSTGPLRDIAKVDYVRSRVVVRLYTRAAGRVDRGTRAMADRAIDALLTVNPDLSRDMIEMEASPDGWSPTLSCRLTTGGRLAGP